MTVIAYKDGVMACDSLWTEGGITAVSRTKIRRLKCGALYGAAGQNDDRALVEILDKIRKPADLPSTKTLLELKSDIHALVVFPSGQIYSLWIEPGDDGQRGATEISIPFFAAGSGGDVALGAMAAGASAREAAAHACDFNLYCRRPIHTLALAKPKPRP